MTTTKPLPPHGSLSRHKYHGCKCDTCYEGYRAYQRSRHRRRGYGTWQPYIDAEPVRQHLHTLREAGIAYTLVAEHLGLPRTAITRFIYDLGPGHPRKKRTRPELAERILAIKPGDITPGLVDPTGTQRRLQALAANGWPLRSLGPHIGINPAQVGRILAQKYVYRRTLQAVADCYETLQGQRPEDHGVTPGSAIKTRNRARRNGWRDPQWWEDMGRIDDSTFDPAAADKPLTRDQIAELRRIDVEFLAGLGHTPEQIAERLGDISLGRTRDLVRAWRTGQTRDRRQPAGRAAA